MASRSRSGRRAAAAPAKDGGGRLAAARGTSVTRALTAHPHWTAALLLALVVLVYLWPALIEGGLLSPTALLYLTHPWQSAAPAGVAQWINVDLGDVPYAYYPWDVLARRFVRAGTFPAWNPYAFGGTPLFANSQIAWLSPFSLPLWILPLHTGLAVAAALKLWAAGFGTYLLARELRLGFWPGIVAGISFALCSFNVVWLSFGVFVSVAAALPWALWLAERIVRRGRLGDGLALAAVLAVALTGGHPGTQVHVLAATVLYALVRSVTVTQLDWRARGERLALAGGGIVVALLLTAVVLLPAQQAAIDTAGAEVRANGAPLFAGSMMPWDVVRTVLFPDWWGRPSEGVLLGPNPAGYRERTFYAGAATLVLALIALASAGGWRRKAPLAAVGALGLGVALRMPGLHAFVIALPGFDRIQNSRIYVLLLLAVAVLAGFGLERVLEARGRVGRGWIGLGIGLLAGIVVLLTLPLGGDTWSTAVDHLLHRSGGDADADAIALASVLRWTAFAAVLAGIVLLLRRLPRRGGAAAVLVALVVAVDMVQFADGYQPIGPPEQVVPPRTPAIAYLQRHQGEGRIAGVQAMSADWTTIYGLRDVRGYDAPLPTTRFFHLWQAMDPSADPYSLNALTDLAPRVLGMLGARLVMLPPAAQVDHDSLRPVYEGEDASVYANAQVAPRAFAARAVRVASSEDEEVAIVMDPAFDPRHEVIVRAGEVDEVDGAVLSSGGGTARVVAEENDAVTLRATLPRAGVVVLGDTWGPGWSVEVDGRAARALEANVVLRGVAVPAGTHEITWRYRVPGLRLGAALSLVGLVAALAWAGVLVVRSRRLRGQ